MLPYSEGCLILLHESGRQAHLLQYSGGLLALKSEDISQG